MRRTRQRVLRVDGCRCERRLDGLHYKDVHITHTPQKKIIIIDFRALHQEVLSVRNRRKGWSGKKVFVGKRRCKIGKPVSGHGQTAFGQVAVEISRNGGTTERVFVKHAARIIGGSPPCNQPSRHLTGCLQMHHSVRLSRPCASPCAHQHHALAAKAHTAWTMKAGAHERRLLIANPVDNITHDPVSSARNATE